MSAGNAEQTVVAERKTCVRRQPKTIHPLATKAAQLEDEALFRLESAQAKRDSVSRKLCGGSSAVSVDDLSRWETELAAAKAALVRLAEHTPLFMKHAALETH